MKHACLILLASFVLFTSCTNSTKTSKTTNDQDRNTLSNKQEPKEQSLDDMINKAITTEHSYDYTILKYRDSMGDHAVIRVKGYTIKDDGAANIKEDSLEFIITDCSEDVKSFLTDKRGEKLSDDKKKIYIDIAVPHIYDPGHVVKKSTEKSQVYLVINVLGDFNRGGWDNTNKVMMFQKEDDLNIPYKDDYKQEDYDHYYDGV